MQLVGRKGPRGETYYHLPAAARYLAEQAAAGEQDPTLPGDQNAAHSGPESGPADPLEGGPESGPGERNSPPGGYGFRAVGGTDSDPQNSSEPKVNGKSSSSAPLITATEWQIDEAARTWLQHHGHVDRLGKHALQTADEKWRSYRAAWAPRTAAAWAADWRAWIAREHTPAPGRPNLYALPGGSSPAPTTGMTRAEAHTAALLAALDEPTGTE